MALKLFRGRAYNESGANPKQMFITQKKTLGHLTRLQTAQVCKPFRVLPIFYPILKKMESYRISNKMSPIIYTFYCLTCWLVYEGGKQKARVQIHAQLFHQVL